MFVNIYQIVGPTSVRLIGHKHVTTGMEVVVRNAPSVNDGLRYDCLLAYLGMEPIEKVGE